MRSIRILLVSCLVGAGAFAVIEIPGDARQGEEVFRTQGCIQCHSIDGKGGNIGPDLGRRIGRNYTPALMASLMWNHAPAMWSAIEQKGVPRPRLTKEQAADLFAFFYSARYFEEPGDAARGKRVFESKGCAGCHGLKTALPGGFGAKPVAQWESLSDPILLAQRMWNHAGQMKQAFAKKKIRWPQLTSQELTDLLVYLQNLPQTRTRMAEFAPASAETGEVLFKAKGCVNCHTGELSLQSRFGKIRNRTITDFAVAMWNHASKRMAGEAPSLRPEEMRRILGYLWSLQLFDQRGNPGRGRKIFEEKRCATCHEDPSTGAPKLSRELNLSSLSMVSVLWEHGPNMLQLMKKKDIPWPRFTGSQMADLIAYLNSKQ